MPLPSTEIATALQTGLVNAITMSPQGVLLMQWQKQLNYMTDLNWAVVPSPTTVLMMPAVLTIRTRPSVVDAFWSMESAMYRFPAESTAEPIGLSNCALVAATLSLPKPSPKPDCRRRSR